MKNLLLVMSIVMVAVTTGCSTAKKQPLYVDVLSITPTKVVVNREQTLAEKAGQSIVNGAMQAAGSLFKAFIGSKVGVSMAGHSQTFDRNAGALIGGVTNAIGSGVDSVIDESQLGPDQMLVDGVAMTLRLPDGRTLATRFQGNPKDYKIGPAEFEIDGHIAKVKPNNLPTQEVGISEGTAGK